MGKGPNFSNPYKNNKELYELASRFDVDPGQFQEEDTGSQGAFDRDGFIEAIEKAARKDIDTRDTIRYAQGVEGYEDMPTSINDISDVHKVHSISKGMHKDVLGHGGKYSSGQDYQNISQYFIDQAGRSEFSPTEDEDDDDKKKDDNSIDFFDVVDPAREEVLRNGSDAAFKARYPGYQGDAYDARSGKNDMYDASKDDEADKFLTGKKREVINMGKSFRR